MKKLFLTSIIALTAFASCTKKSNDDLKPATTTTKTVIAKTKVEAISKAGNPRYLDITISYGSDNTPDYVDDLIMVFSKDSMVYANYVGPLGGDQVVNFKSPSFTNTCGWKLILLREKTNGKDTIALTSGN